MSRVSCRWPQAQRDRLPRPTPATVAFNLLAAVAVHRWPGALIDAGGHVMIAVAQLAAALGYLLYVMRFFTRIRPLIVTTRREWRDDVLP
jgi:hypothetical protein